MSAFPAEPTRLSSPQRQDLAAKRAAAFLEVPAYDLKFVLKFDFSFWVMIGDGAPLRVETVCMIGDKPYDPDFWQMKN